MHWAGPRVASRSLRQDRRGPAVSSTASNVSATPAVASSPWPQTAAATQDSTQDHSGGPFAALLDAAATAPDTTNTQPQPAVPRTSAAAAANQLGAKFATHLN